MKICITGAAGFLGRNLTNWILDNTEHSVIGVDKIAPKELKWIDDNKRFVYVYCPIERDELQSVFKRHRPSIAYALASYASEGRANHIRKFIHSNNTVGMANVINACINNNCKIIFTSSVAVYSGLPPFDEETIPNPIDEYGLSKLSTEKSIEISGNVNNLEWSIIRPRNVYGIYQNMFDKTLNLFGIFFYKYFNNQPLTIFGDGSNQRNFTYIDDILEPMYNAIKYDRQIFNLGSSKVYTIKQAAEIFCEVTGYNKIEYVEPRHEVPAAFCKTDKSEQLLGYKDITSLYDGLKKMYVWAKEQKIKPLEIPPPLEITKNMHSSLL